MNNFVFSINATIPIFLMILLGWFLMKIHLITEEFAEVANKYVFKIALPVMLFKDIATTSILKDMNIKFVLFCFFGTIAMFILVWLIAVIYCKEKNMRGAFAQGAARGSAAILGVAFVENICGNSGMAPLMIVAAVPLFNIISVIMLTFGGNERVSGGKGIKKAFINILKNPIIIGIILGIPFSVFDIDIPAIPIRTINYIAQTATPIALIAVGAGFSSKQALGRLKPAIVGSLIKLVVLPALFVMFAIWLDFSPSEIIAVLIMTGAPSTVSGYVMAKNMNNDAVLASNLIVLTTLLSSVTLTIWVFILKSLGYV
ncbi:MAG: AEC family transporter [Coprococcus sp.]